MSNNDVFDRNAILNTENMDYGFDKAIRGYDIKQVNEYISNLISANKNASEVFDTRLEEIKNENAMLKYELSQKKGEVEKVNALLEKLRTERDGLQEQAANSKSVQAVDDAVLDEYKKKIDSLVAKNRLLGDENKKLEEKNRDLQRDVAHLTKKVDKNRNEIKDLRGELETGITDDSEKKYIEMAQIYAGAIDRAEDLIHKLQTEISLAHSKVEDIGAKD